jgi:hypothetical protein
VHDPYDFEGIEYDAKIGGYVKRAVAKGEPNSGVNVAVT